MRLISVIIACTLFFPELVFAASGEGRDFTLHWVGFVSLALFVFAYSLVVAEESLRMRKSQPVMVAAGIIWALTAYAYNQAGDIHFAGQAMRHNLLEYAELFLFLLAAMTYINTMNERGIFNMLRVWMVSHGFSLRKIFWMTGVLAFFISPVADNLTTALLMATVIMAVGKDNKPFVVVACVNVVVAANAGGAFSPFGDITTLMVWQKGIVQFQEFFVLFVPSVVNWIVPAVIMSFSVSGEKPEPIHEQGWLRHGAFTVVALFILTIAMAVSVHNYLHLPPVLGMMTGLGFLKFYSYYLNYLDRQRLIAMNKPPVLKRSTDGAFGVTGHIMTAEGGVDVNHPDGRAPFERKGFNIFRLLARAEWDTLMFFYGIILWLGAYPFD